MFHRVDEPMDLPSSRYFRMAERLHLRGGALAAALSAGSSAAAVREGASFVTPPGESSPGFVAAGTPEDIATMAAMSQNPGFPGVGYSGG